MLDTRNYDRSITTLNWNDDYIEELKDDAGRSLMGSRQENWFYNSLSKSQERGAQWRIIGNQIIFSRMNNSAVYANPLNADQWDVCTFHSHLLPYHYPYRVHEVGIELVVDDGV
jgi:alkaline phosphatase D